MTSRRTIPVVAVALAVGAAVVAVVWRGGDTTATTADAPPTGPSPAEVVSFDVESPLIDTSAPGGTLDDDRTTPQVKVLLPAGYHDDQDAAYPVLWLLHGADHGADAWLPGIETLAAGLEAIIVTPDGGTYGMYTDWWSNGARADPAWATFHLDTVRGEVERRFRVREGRRWHAIAGVSMGGQGALRYAAMLPGYFGSVATFSAAMPDMQSGIAAAQVAGLARGDADYDDVFGPADGPYATGNSPSALAPNLSHTRVFVTSGDGTTCAEDPVNPDSIDNDAMIEGVINAEQSKFVELARAGGADVTAATTCGVHTFGVWDRAFTSAREWGFFEQVDEQPDSWSMRTVATSGEAWGLPYEFDAPPNEVVTLAREGDMVTDTAAAH